LPWLEELAEKLWAYLPIIAQYVVLVAVALLIERLITRRIRRAVEKLQLPADVGNALILTTRVIVLVAASIVAMSIGGVPSSWLVSLSALGGMAIGFASTRSIGNLIAGIYIILARPFRIGDYVRIGGLEGVVEEITINYTKLRRPDGTLVLVSNQKSLESDIINFSVELGEDEKLFCYSFRMGFDHSIPSEELEGALGEALKRAAGDLPRSPELKLVKCDRGGREYEFIFFVRDARDIMAVKHELMSALLKAWEALRARRR